MSKADHIVIIGSSLLVYPVNTMLLRSYIEGKMITIIDPDPFFFDNSGLSYMGFYPNERTRLITSDADSGMMRLKAEMILG